MKVALTVGSLFLMGYVIWLTSVFLIRTGKKYNAKKQEKKTAAKEETADKQE